jgi:antitoxin CptB
MNSAEDNKARYRWACRRGMLELDLLLLPFFENHFSTLSAEQQGHFVQLLDCTDPELFSWLMGHSSPEQPELAALVRIIRNANYPQD